MLLKYIYIFLYEIIEMPKMAGTTFWKRLMFIEDSPLVVAF